MDTGKKKMRTPVDGPPAEQAGRDYPGDVVSWESLPDELQKQVLHKVINAGQVNPKYRDMFPTPRNAIIFLESVADWTLESILAHIDATNTSDVEARTGARPLIS